MGNSQGHSPSTPHSESKHHKSKSAGVDTPTSAVAKSNVKKAQSQFYEGGEKYYTCKPGLSTSASDPVENDNIPSYYFTGGRINAPSQPKPSARRALNVTLSSESKTAAATVVVAKKSNSEPNTMKQFRAKKSQGDDADDIDSGYLTASTGFPTAQPTASTISRDNLHARIEKFNTNSLGLKISLNEKGTVEGFIRVHIHIEGEISMRAPDKLPSLSDVMSRSCDSLNNVPAPVSLVETKFRLPPGTTKLVHINDKHHTKDVIHELLTKFNITDSPLRFVLCEKDPSTTMMRKLHDDEVPLLLSLSWSDEGMLDRKEFILKENADAVQWDAFSLPELNNFIRFLEQEEEEQVVLIRDRFRELREHIMKRLQCLSAAQQRVPAGGD